MDGKQGGQVLEEEVGLELEAVEFWGGGDHSLRNSHSHSTLNLEYFLPAESSNANADQE